VTADRTALFNRLGAATLGEAGGHPMAPRIKAAWPGAAMAGPAYTAAIPAGDNLAIHAAVATAPPGSIIAVEVGEDTPYGYWGEVLTVAAQARGLAGLVIDGGVRDVTAVAARRFPMFSAVIALRGAAKVGPGRVETQVRVGDVVVSQGDWVVGDADGVTVIEAGQLDAVGAAGLARAEREAELFAALTAGQTTVELFTLDPNAVTGPPGVAGGGPG
jgi:4-hydroxy-4-methyl-2-oxoglutarate aldolase